MSLLSLTPVHIQHLLYVGRERGRCGAPPRVSEEEEKELEPRNAPETSRSIAFTTETGPASVTPTKPQQQILPVYRLQLIHPSIRNTRIYTPTHSPIQPTTLSMLHKSTHIHTLTLSPMVACVQLQSTRKSMASSAMALKASQKRLWVVDVCVLSARFSLLGHSCYTVHIYEGYFVV